MRTMDEQVAVLLEILGTERDAFRLGNLRLSICGGPYRQSTAQASK